MDGDYPYVVAIMSTSPGYIGLELAQELAPVLDQIHDEMIESYTSGVGALLEDSEALAALVEFASQAISSVTGLNS